MGLFTIDYKTHGTKIVNAYKRAYNYQDTIDDGAGNMIPNPESAQDMTKRKILEFIKSTVAVNSDGVIDADLVAEAAKAADRLENEDMTIS